MDLLPPIGGETPGGPDPPRERERRPEPAPMAVPVEDDDDDDDEEEEQQQRDENEQKEDDDVPGGGEGPGGDGPAMIELVAPGADDIAPGGADGPDDGEAAPGGEPGNELGGAAEDEVVPGGGGGARDGRGSVEMADMGLGDDVPGGAPGADYILSLWPQASADTLASVSAVSFSGVEVSPAVARIVQSMCVEVERAVSPDDAEASESDSDSGSSSGSSSSSSSSSSGNSSDESDSGHQGLDKKKKSKAIIKNKSRAKNKNDKPEAVVPDVDESDDDDEEDDEDNVSREQPISRAAQEREVSRKLRLGLHERRKVAVTRAWQGFQIKRKADMSALWGLESKCRALHMAMLVSFGSDRTWSIAPLEQWESLASDWKELKKGCKDDAVANRAMQSTLNLLACVDNCIDDEITPGRVLPQTVQDAMNDIDQYFKPQQLRQDPPDMELTANVTQVEDAMFEIVSSVFVASINENHTETLVANLLDDSVGVVAAIDDMLSQIELGQVDFEFSGDLPSADAVDVDSYNFHEPKDNKVSKSKSRSKADVPQSDAADAGGADDIGRSRSVRFLDEVDKDEEVERQRKAKEERKRAKKERQERVKAIREKKSRKAAKEKRKKKKLQAAEDSSEDELRQEMNKIAVEEEEEEDDGDEYKSGDEEDAEEERRVELEAGIRRNEEQGSAGSSDSGSSSGSDSGSEADDDDAADAASPPRKQAAADSEEDESPDDIGGQALQLRGRGADADDKEMGKKKISMKKKKKKKKKNGGNASESDESAEESEQETGGTSDERYGSRPEYSDIEEQEDMEIRSKMEADKTPAYVLFPGEFKKASELEPSIATEVGSEFSSIGDDDSMDESDDDHRTIRDLFESLNIDEDFAYNFEDQDIEYRDLESLKETTVQMLIPEKEPRQLFLAWHKKQQQARRDREKLIEKQAATYGKGADIPDTIRDLFEQLKIPSRHADYWEDEEIVMSDLMAISKEKLEYYLPANGPRLRLRGWLKAYGKALKSKRAHLLRIEAEQARHKKVYKSEEYVGWLEQHSQREHMIKDRVLRRERKALEARDKFYLAFEAEEIPRYHVSTEREADANYEEEEVVEDEANKLLSNDAREEELDMLTRMAERSCASIEELVVATRPEDDHLSSAVYVEALNQWKANGAEEDERVFRPVFDAQDLQHFYVNEEEQARRLAAQRSSRRSCTSSGDCIIN